MTTNQPHPEAVEAAARALYEAVESATRGSLTWDQLTEGHRQKPYPDYPHLYDTYVQRARAALSAALPLLPDVGDLLAEMDRLRAVTVKPDRDTIARAIHRSRCSVRHCGNPLNTDYLAADAVSAVLPGRTEAQIKAEALDEAAGDHFRESMAVGHGDPGATAAWLRRRANSISERGVS